MHVEMSFLKKYNTYVFKLAGKNVNKKDSRNLKIESR